MKDHGARPFDPDLLHYFDTEEVQLDDLGVAGPILDLGGGGEGIIGRLAPDQVVAIDPSRGELKGTPAGPLKIVMDARDLLFLDCSFGTATAFFTLMYISAAEHPVVFGEVHRVLSPGGSFLVWDMELPPRRGEAGEFAVIPLTVQLPSGSVETGYGTRWPTVAQDLAYYASLGEAAGFELVTSNQQGRVLRLHFRKPA